MPKALVVIKVVLVGLMVGVEFSVAAFINPIFNRLPERAGLAARSDGARILGRVMPFWYAGSVVLAVLWVVLAWGQPRVLLVVMAAALLVPINLRVARWSGGDIPNNWQSQLARWDRFHHLRVAVIAAAFTLLTVAGFE